MAVGSDPLLRHIRHAEEWLRRARADWRRGNAPAAMLRLMLAEAEIRHARETGAGASVGRTVVGGERRARWPRSAAAIVAAAVVAAGLGYASMRTAPARHDALVSGDGSAAGLPRDRGPAGAGPLRMIVRLDSGQLLMPDRGRPAGGPAESRPLQLAVPVDLRTPSPTF